MKAMIFAAGMGTRIKPITDTIPKALVPVCSQPLLKHLIDKLKDAGYTSVVINVHHFAEKIREYVAQNNNFGIEISFSDESDLLSIQPYYMDLHGLDQFPAYPMSGLHPSPPADIRFHHSFPTTLAILDPVQDQV